MDEQIKLERQTIVHGKRVLGYNGLKIGNVLPIELRIGNSREVFQENVKTLSVDGQKKLTNVHNYTSIFVY